MPGLSGSDRAYKHARFGIARFDASRFGFYTYNHIVRINGSTVRIDRRSLSLRLTRNDEPDEASFRIPVTSVSAPTCGHTVSVNVGTSDNPIFAGQIVAVRHVRYREGQSPRYEVECTDWSKLFNRRLVTFDFSGQTATAIAQYVIANYTSGFFDYAVEPSLATIGEFICINEEPLRVLSRLAHLLGGGCYIDARKIVHLFDDTGPSSIYTPTPPVSLTSATVTLEAFQPEHDYTQIRTRVIVEGIRTSCPLSIPADVTLPNNSFPVEDSTAFSATGGVARIGTQRFTYTTRNYPVVPGVNAEGTFVAADAAAGATSLEVNSIAFLISTGTEWFQAGDQVLHLEGASSGPPATINIPAAGLGSLQHALGAGESIRALGTITGATLTLAQEAGAEVVAMAIVDDTTAQTTLAALEGDDGIHEHIVVDGRLSTDGCTERAQAELDVFSETLTRASWVTYDMNALPGSEQVINFGSPDTLSTTLMIDTVTVTFPKRYGPPRRVCQGSTVKLAKVLDAIQGGTKPSQSHQPAN